MVGGWEKAPRRVRITGAFADQRLDGRFSRHVDFQNATVERADFRGFRFEMFTSSGSRFVDCDFSGASFRQGSFSGDPASIFIGCRFDGADLRRIGRLRDTRFERCSFRGAKIEQWNSFCAEFVDCTFQGRLKSVQFYGRPLYCFGAVSRDRNAFRGNDFRDADLAGVSFVYGIDLDAQRLPDGPAYRRFDQWGMRLAWARDSVRAWTNQRHQKEALRVIDAYGGPGHLEQDEVFVRTDDFWIPAGIRQDLWSLIDGAPTGRSAATSPGT